MITFYYWLLDIIVFCIHLCIVIIDLCHEYIDVINYREGYKVIKNADAMSPNHMTCMQFLEFVI